MDIKVILFLLAIFGTPVLLLFASVSKILPIKSNLKLALLSFSIIYAVIVGTSQIANYQIEQELSTYDLNGDGMFSPEEMTPEAEQAMARYTNDTGSTFAPITGFIFSLIYVTLFFGIVKLINKHVFKNT